MVVVPIGKFQVTKISNIIFMKAHQLSGIQPNLTLSNEQSIPTLTCKSRERPDFGRAVDGFVTGHAQIER